MAMANVTWKDDTGAFRSASVTIENSSTYGACIRTHAAIAIGSRLKVDWRGGQFSGVAKYCRQYHQDFIVGIRRNARESALSASLSPESAKRLRPPSVITSQIVRGIRQLIPGNSRDDTRSRTAAAAAPTTLHPDFAPGEAAPEENIDTCPDTEPQIHVSALAESAQPLAREARTSMLTKWLRRTPQHGRVDVQGPLSPASPNTDGEWRTNVDSPTQSFSQISQQSDPVPAAPGGLLPLEDIYSARGIIGLRMGYSINKVVDMLGSDRARELPNDMKRASVLIALDAAGISLDEVLQDAELRLDALSTYEVDQKGKLAAYESVKVRENAEIQAEMERVTARYLERLKLNMDEVDQMRRPFVDWQTMKQREERMIAEAVELCAKNGQEPPGEFRSSVSASVPQTHQPALTKCPADSIIGRRRM